jgi:hypothetical protein
VASQQQPSDQTPAAPSAGPLGEARTLLPPPANDNRGRPAVRIAVAFAAALIAVGLAILALHPFG